MSIFLTDHGQASSPNKNPQFLQCGWALVESMKMLALCNSSLAIAKGYILSMPLVTTGEVPNYLRNYSRGLVERSSIASGYAGASRSDVTGLPPAIPFNKIAAI
jgi:hypothetical protein